MIDTCKKQVVPRRKRGIMARTVLLVELCRIYLVERGVWLPGKWLYHERGLG